MKSLFIYSNKLCNLLITEEQDAICNISFINKSFRRDFTETKTPLIGKTIQQLDEYLNKKRKVFDLPIILNGTEFQVKIWNILQTIPYGETWSYEQLAVKSGSPKACRAAGMANNRNPIPIIIPCHRVIGKDGSLTGYAGGLELKQKLLNLENSINA
ncbi:MAG: methylated-DNA--[protein]-cysteine S-methyltransferase [Treponema sp.]|nr:methylated-DNA--[protein]-cysteine S-methyltransferase [Treponema sp.]